MGFWEKTTSDVSDTAQISVAVEELEFGVKKVWENDTEADRPNNIYVELHRGITVDNQSKVENSQKTLNVGNNWKLPGCWKGLPKYDGDGNEYIYTIVETGFPERYTSSNYLDSTTNDFIITNTLKNKGSLTVKKTDMYGTLLSGATFKLTKGTTAGNIVSETSSEAGIINYTNLDDGTYYLTETASPSGYLLPSGNVEFVVSNGKTTMSSNGYGSTIGSFNETSFTYTLKNEPKEAELIVKKTDTSGSALDGATFQLSNSSGTVISSTNGGTGIFKYSKLTEGTYFLVETAAPSGYICPTGRATFKVTDGEITMTSNSYGNLGNFNSGTFTFTMKNDRPLPDNTVVQVRKTNSVTGNALSGVEFTLKESGSAIQSVTTGSSGVASFTFDSSMFGKTYEIQETGTPSGYEDNNDYCEFAINSDGTIKNVIKFNGGTFTGGTNLYTFTHKNVPVIEKAELTVKKTDMSGTLLSGATFKLTKGMLTGTEVSETYAGTGIIKYSNLDDGTYYLTETAAPSGYKLPFGHVEFKVLSGNISIISNNYGSLSTFNVSTFTYSLKNERPDNTTVQVKKTDSVTGEALSGVGFTLKRYTVSGSILDTVTTDSSGIATFTFDSSMFDKTYVIQETSTPAGYEYNDGHCQFYVNAAGTVTSSLTFNDGSFYESSNIYTFTHKNTPTIDSGLTVRKTNPSGTELSGATFKLTKGSTEGNEIIGTSEGTGIIKYSNLEDDTYYLTETASPTGYELPSGSVRFVVADGKTTMAHNDYGSLGSFNSETFTYTMKNNPVIISGGILIQKTDSKTGLPLAGVTFTMSGENDMEVVTDGGGSAYFPLDLSNLSSVAGNYTITETATPEGYIKNNDSCSFQVTRYGNITEVIPFKGGTYNNENNLITFTHQNTPIPDLKVMKTDMDGNPLDGATFKLTKDTEDVEIIGTPAETGVIDYKNLEDGTYYLTEMESPDGYILPSGSVEFEVADSKVSIVSNGYDGIGSFAEDTFTYTLKNEPIKAELMVKKTDMSGTLLNGATFKLTRETLTGKEVTGTSAGTGIIKYSNLENGTYYLTEIKSPEGYKLPLNNVKFKVLSGKLTMESNGYGILGSFEEDIFTYTLKNEPKDTVVQVKKTDSITGKALKGAKFTLKKDSTSGAEIKSITTDSSGIASFTLDSSMIGKEYVIQETGVPRGYLYNNDNCKFKVNTGGIINNIIAFKDGTFTEEMNLYTFTHKNVPRKAELTVKKTSVDGVLLDGATFELRRDTQAGIEVHGTITEPGVIHYTNLEDGPYYLIETKSPDGYQLPFGYVKFNIEFGYITMESNNYGKLGEFVNYDEINTYTLTNKRVDTKIRVEKTDSKTGKVLPGVTFTLKSLSEALVESVVTDKDGIAEFTIEEKDFSHQYTIEETATPAGYVGNNDMCAFNLYADGTVTLTVSGSSFPGGTFTPGKNLYTFTHKNTPLPDLKIMKTNISGTAIYGATFELKKDNSLTGELVSSTPTSETGTFIYSNLEDGTYYLTETAAPMNYKLPEGNVEFKVTDGKITMERNDYNSLGAFNEDAYTYTLQNESTLANGIQVMKTDSKTGLPLAGVTFTMSGNKHMEAVTDGGGSAYFPIDSSNPESVAGNYTITETATPEGYIKNNDSCSFQITKYGNITEVTPFKGGTYNNENNLITFTHQNTPLPDLKVMKTNTSGNALGGASFELRKDSPTGSPISITSGESSYFTYGKLEDGIYYLKETSSASGYKLPEGYVEFKVFNGIITIESDGYGSLGSFSESTYTYTLKNERLDTKVRVKKIDSKTGETLPGVTFSLRAGDENSLIGPILESVVTDMNGIAEFIFEEKDFGKKFSIQETATPAGYVTNQDYCKFIFELDGKVSSYTNFPSGTVTFEGHDITFTHQNTPIPDLKVMKTDMDGKPLDGAIFKLIKDADDTEISGVIGDSGMITYQQLDDGLYYLSEEMAPNKYMKLEGNVEFTITNGVITISKTSSTDWDDAGTFDSDTFTYTLKNEKETYVLPDTGGPGTTGFISGGLIMVSMAVLMLINKKRKMRRIK